MNAVSLARLLGWFSLGLGAAEIASPDRLADGVGLPAWGALVRAFGYREIAAGAIVLARPDSAWGPAVRVAGDTLDLAVLGAGMSAKNRRRRKSGLAFALVAGVTALDVLCLAGLLARRRPAH